MPLILTEEQTMLRESVRGLLGEKAPIAHLRKLRDERDPLGVSRALWQECADLGLAGLMITEAHGGQGLGAVEAGVVMEEIGCNLVPSPFLATALLAATALQQAGSAAQKSEHLPPIAAGKRIAAVAIDEGRKHNPAGIALEAKRAGNGFALTGAKALVVDGHVADLLIVAARTSGTPGDRDGLTLFLVDPKARGLTIERTVMVDAHNAARLELRGVEVDADAVLGEVDQGWRTLERILNVGRGAVAAEMCGIGEEAFARTTGYLRERKQFGKAIGSFQALQHRAAHLYSELEITRAAVLKALQTLDTTPEQAGPAIAVAKARAGKSTTLAVQEAVQMHGGMGMTDQFDVGLFMKRARVTQELFGDAAFHANELARLKSY
jgi:acyl-CoA dehydrogenase